MASSESKVILSNLPITVNLSECEKILCFLYNSKKAPHGSFYEDEWFLYSNAFTHCISFEFDFVDMTLDNYG